MSSEPLNLESLAFHWGDAYLLSYVQDRWVALRRNGHFFLIADTLAGLEHAIEDDYRHHPVPRDFDPPNATDYLDGPEDDDLDPRLTSLQLRHLSGGSATKSTRSS